MAMVPSATGDVVVELLPHDALRRPAEAVTVEGDRSAEVGYAQGDEEDLRLHSNSLPAITDKPVPGVLQPGARQSCR